MSPEAIGFKMIRYLNIKHDPKSSAQPFCSTLSPLHSMATLDHLRGFADRKNAGRQ